MHQKDHAQADLADLRVLAGHAFSRAAGAPLIPDNQVRLLRDAAENYPAWLTAIAAAQRHIHLESYILYDDETGRRFAEALMARARDGVRVRLIYDWLGGVGKSSRKFWSRLRASGVDVRCYNPPRLDRPLGWISRDHRKMLAVDGEVGFVSGLCIGRAWEGVPAKRIEPWRDTGVEVRGPAVAEIEKAFAQVWAMMGEPLPAAERPSIIGQPPAGTASLRVVANVPATAGLFRLDQLVAALARKRLWLTDAYYAGNTMYVQALRAAARDGVEVCLLVPNATDIPVVRALSRAGYRTLLEAGVRVFEWNGTMLHAKTALADGIWARVGSTNLNISSWIGNCELDVVVEDQNFAAAMERMYLEDLDHATEIVLSRKQKVLAPGEPAHTAHAVGKGSGSAGRAAAGAVRIGHAVGAAITGRRLLGPVEARLMLLIGALFVALAALAFWLPALLVYPAILLFAWLGIVLIARGLRLILEKRRKE
ncbi:MAG TPA: phospholipase D-like domain-containing protein [bacterium]|nr:phospholipase D-like domain-containing protein [bacterium]HQI49392.1 phospholipase D-like domain-containing protein [bacterium]HQJ65339.1 phospholipase D-like domain-containing protein [bacterium]